jgi:hypothetical protein
VTKKKCSLKIELCSQCNKTFFVTFKEGKQAQVFVPNSLSSLVYNLQAIQLSFASLLDSLLALLETHRPEWKRLSRKNALAYLSQTGFQHLLTKKSESSTNNNKKGRELENFV